MTSVDQWLALSGRSMWPLGPPLRVGIAHTPWQSLRPGDLVAFVAADAGQVWLHRVHAIAASGVQTRGDTRTSPDPQVPHSAVIGRVVAWRLGPMTVAVAVCGPRAQLRRRVGLAWSLVAPHLRRGWAGWRKC